MDLHSFFPQDYDKKTALFALLGLLVNVAFALFNAVMAALWSSAWYASLAGYYTALILLRGGVVLTQHKLHARCGGDAHAFLLSQWKVFIGCGALLLVFELAMCGAVTAFIVGGRSAQSGEIGEIYAIATAAYTFYKAVGAIVQLVRSRQRGNPVTQALRAVGIADACTSMVSLTVLMLATFGGDGMMSVKACVGFGAVAVTAAMAVYMIVRGCLRLRTLRAAGAAPRSMEEEDLS